MKDKSVFNLIGGFLFTLITAVLIYIIATNKVRADLEPILIIIVGMTSLASVAAFQRLMESGNKGTSIAIMPFNENIVKQIVDEAIENHKLVDNDEWQRRRLRTGDYYEDYWDRQPYGVPHSRPRYSEDEAATRYIGLDNSLALAGLRLNIEDQLRRVGTYNNIHSHSRLLGVNELIQELVSKGVIPAAWVGTLKDILSICNRAVHGADIPNDTTLSVIRAGNYLLDGLNYIKYSDHDLRGLNLEYVDFEDKNLARVDLRQAYLASGNLSGADLSEANLSKATLVGANLVKANLTKANLIEANLSNAKIMGASLKEANLTRAKLAGADLKNADVSGAIFDGADLTDAVGLTSEIHQLARISESTKLPDNLVDKDTGPFLLGGGSLEE